MIKIILKNLPIALKRPRLSQHGVYDSQSKTKNGIELLLRSKYSGKPIESYCHVKLDFHFSSRDNLELWNIKKPTKSDLDNLVKFILDVGNNILWKDDRLIASIECTKRYSEESFTLIEVTPMIEPNEAHLKVFKTISPTELDDMINDFNEVKLGYCTSSSDVAEGLIKFSNKWCSILKKLGTIK